MNDTQSERRNTEADLIRLSHDFAYYIDHREYDALVELFTPDALLDRVLEVHRGHTEIRNGMAQRRQDMLIRHVSTNFHYDHLSADEVKGVVYNMSYYGRMTTPGHAPADYAGLGMLLEFHDRYLRTPDGWRFAERIVRPVLLGPDAPLRAGPAWQTEPV